MKPDKRQVSFYCTDELYDQIQAEKVLRDRSAQEIIRTALTHYFSKSSTDGKRADSENTRLLRLCSKYAEQMPRLNSRFLERFLILELQHYGASRLKTSARRAK